MCADGFYTKYSSVIEVQALGFDSKRVDKVTVCIGVGYYRLDEVNREKEGFILQCNWCILITNYAFVKYSLK
jgi:hypothetical protein